MALFYSILAVAAVIGAVIGFKALLNKINSNL